MSSTLVASLTEALSTLSIVALAVMFGIAAAAKFHDQTQTAADFRQLGVPSWLTPLVPMIETGVAVMLILRPRIGGIAALGLLAAFSLVLARALRSKPESSISCSCFGALGAKAVTTSTLIRNSGFMVAALVAAFGSGLARPDLAAVITISMVGLIAALAAQLIVIYKQLGRLWSVELAGEIPAPLEEN